METRDSRRKVADKSKKKYSSRNRKRRLRMLRIRAAVIFVLAVIVVIVLLFATPIFNIKNISVSGNKIVTLDQINMVIGDVVGENLFSTWDSTIEKKLKEIAYIDEVSIGKALIPPTLYVNVRECEIAAYVEHNGKQVIMNSNMKILDDSNTFSLDSVPLVRGIEIKNYNVGRQLEIKDKEKQDSLAIFLKTMTSVGQLGDVLYIDLSSITDIKFNYQGTLEVYCGSSLELDKKLRMFNSVMKSGSIKEDARGTIDLSNPEKAIHIQ